MRKDIIVKAVILLFVNSLIFIFWALAGVDDHGQSKAIINSIFALTSILLIGAIAALIKNKQRLSLLLGLTMPISLFSYAAIASILGQLIEILE